MSTGADMIQKDVMVDRKKGSDKITDASLNIQMDKTGVK